MSCWKCSYLYKLINSATDIYNNILKIVRIGTASFRKYYSIIYIIYIYIIFCDMFAEIIKFVFLSAPIVPHLHIYCTKYNTSIKKRDFYYSCSIQLGSLEFMNTTSTHMQLYIRSNGTYYSMIFDSAQPFVGWNPFFFYLTKCNKYNGVYASILCAASVYVKTLNETCCRTHKNVNTMWMPDVIRLNVEYGQRIM